MAVERNIEMGVVVCNMLTEHSSHEGTITVIHNCLFNHYL